MFVMTPLFVNGSPSITLRFAIVPVSLFVMPPLAVRWFEYGPYDDVIKPLFTTAPRTTSGMASVRVAPLFRVRELRELPLILLGVGFVG
jgi:hypothetical protein